MKVLLVHNRYRLRGGEDGVVDRDRALLERNGHRVELLEASNEAISGVAGAIAAGARAVYSLPWRRRVAQAIAVHRPDLVHVHNTFPLISPSVYDACRAAAVPVVQTLHNYRLACANALCLRAGAPCEECVDRALPWPALVHGCYRGSRIQTAAVVAVTATHRLRGTWRRRVDAYIALTEFQKRLIERAGVPPERIHVRPNWGEEPAVAGGPGRGDYVLFVGRLSPEKGVATLVDAAATAEVPLVIAGDGPLRAELEARAQALGAATRIRFVGWQSPAEISRLIAGARCVACPSAWYEAGPLVIVEAFALGRAVIAARIGALAEAVEEGVTGWLVPPGDPAAWRVALEQAWADPDDAQRRGAAARRRYEDAYSPSVGYRRLMDIYGAVLGRAHAQL